MATQRQQVDVERLESFAKRLEDSLGSFISTFPLSPGYAPIADDLFRVSVTGVVQGSDPFDEGMLFEMAQDFGLGLTIRQSRTGYGPITKKKIVTLYTYVEVKP